MTASPGTTAHSAYRKGPHPNCTRLQAGTAGSRLLIQELSSAASIRAGFGRNRMWASYPPRAGGSPPAKPVRLADRKRHRVARAPRSCLQERERLPAFRHTPPRREGHEFDRHSTHPGGYLQHRERGISARGASAGGTDMQRRGLAKAARVRGSWGGASRTPGRARRYPREACRPGGIWMGPPPPVESAPDRRNRLAFSPVEICRQHESGTSSPARRRGST